MNKLTRRIEAWNYLEVFLVSAVLAILFIRFFLRYTHYPQWGGARLHIAHMLWGGLLMMAAIVAFFSLMGHKVLRLASLLGGLGFGTFIDEIGKFLTRDNNYFFQPSIALIYFIFILIFLAVRAFFHNKTFSQQEYWANAMELAGEMANDGLDEEWRTKLLLYLQKCDSGNPLVRAISEVIAHAAFRPCQERSWARKARAYCDARYQKLAASPGFENGVILFFFLEAMITLGTTVLLVFFPACNLRPILHTGMGAAIAKELRHPSFLGLAEYTSSWLSAFFVFLGIFQIREKRLKAFRMFEYAILISILLTQFFAFYREQLGAFFGLLLNLAVWVSLRSMIAIEKLKRHKEDGGRFTVAQAT